MSVLEIALLFVAGGFALYGMMLGLIQAIGSIVGLYVGFAFATRYVDGVAHFLTPFFGGNEIAATITGFILLFIIASKLVGILFLIIDKIFRIASLIPGLQLLNRLGGFFLGLLEGIIVVGIILNVLMHLPVSAGTASTVNNSTVLRLMVDTSKVVTALYPSAFQSIGGILR